VHQADGVTPAELQRRTLNFSVAVYQLARPLLRAPDTRHLAQQLLRAATSVAANYRAACLARSHAEWVAKIGLVREEADEALFWLVFLTEAEVVPAADPALTPLLAEAQELTRLFAAAYKTSAGARTRNPGTRNPGTQIRSIDR
jgi:four helix bundle protein